jgi:hypothetical protein
MRVMQGQTLSSAKMGCVDMSVTADRLLLGCIVCGGEVSTRSCAKCDDSAFAFGIMKELRILLI